MWSLETINHLNQQAARKARQAKKKPFVPALDDIKAFPPFPFPNLGPHVPAGWEPVGEAKWFVDSSGWGRNDEPALSVEQFKAVLQLYIGENPTHGFAIVESGQFQCYVSAFRPAAKGKVAA